MASWTWLLGLAKSAWITWQGWLSAARLAQMGGHGCFGVEQVTPAYRTWGQLSTPPEEISAPNVPAKWIQGWGQFRVRGITIMRQFGSNGDRRGTFPHQKKHCPILGPRHSGAVELIIRSGLPWQMPSCLPRWEAQPGEPRLHATTSLHPCPDCGPAATILGMTVWDISQRTAWNSWSFVCSFSLQRREEVSLRSILLRGREGGSGREKSAGIEKGWVTVRI